jgi:fumarylpyruvate hydrolase
MISKDYLFDLPRATVAIEGISTRFPVHRIYCIGRNYADHAKEMGAPTERGVRPVVFMKPADAVCAPGFAVPYPSASSNVHFEAELVIALHSGGTDISINNALKHVYGYAIGNDLTRRDLQLEAKKAGLPWDISKGFDHSAPISGITPTAACGHIARGEMVLKQNGEVKQRADLSDMLWSVPEIMSELSKLFELQAGDLIFTGTPAGVGPIHKGDQIEISIAGLGSLQHGVV